jgi:hypothetical protein
MLVIEEVGRVPGVHGHRLEATPLLESRACPLPYSAHARLTSEFIAVACHRHGVPMLESNISTIEVEKESVLTLPDRARNIRRWCFFDAVI